MSIDITTLALAKEYTNRMVGSGGTGGGVNGKDGITPHIGDNGNWFIGTVDTGISAQGPAGENGVTPHIGTNGNWYIGSANTGVSAKGAKGDNGLDGNGIKYAILNSDYTLTLTFDDGTTYTTPSIRGATGSSGKDGSAGAAGKDGTDGVGIASIEQTATSTADGGSNVFTVTLTNGTTATFTVKNGSKGSTGKDGSNGVDGGHYTPVVTQPTTDTMRISFAPSKSDMPAVNPVTVNLPVNENSGQNVELDSSLTQSGKAADAKATGDEIKRVEGLIPSIEGLAKTEDIPKVPNWAMQTSKPGYTASEVGADPKGTAAGAVSAHNVTGDAHNDIRQEIKAIREQLATFLDVDEETLNELSELIAAIAANQTSIAQLTSNKVSVTDIIDNLTTNVANKPLSATQGVVLKTLIDGLSTGKLDASALQSAINTALAQAKASGAFDGAKGDPGRGIKSIVRTSGNGAAGTTDTNTITYTDGTTSTFTVRNGSNGAAGKAATFEITGVTALAYGAAPTVTEASGSTAPARKYVVGIPAGKPGADGTTPHIGANGNWYIGDTDTGQPSLVLADGKYQYVRKSNLTDGYFWYDDSASELPYKYKYADYTVLEPLALRAGTYYLSALINVYSWVVGSDGVPVRMDAFEPDSAVTTGGFVLTLNEDSTVYLGYHTPAQITASTPYVLDGDKPLDGGYFEGEYKFSLENLLNYGIFVESYIKNGELVANALGVSGDTQGHYTGVKMGANIAEIRCKACFVTGASVALVTTDLGSSMVSDVTFGSVHLVFSLDGCSVGVFDTKDKLRSITHYSYTITEGAEVAFGFAVDEATNILTVHLPDGATKTVTDDTIGALNGKYAIWEHFCNTASHDFVCCRMTRLYCKDASGEVLDDNLRRLDGAIGVAPTGQVYRQFTTHNLNNRDFV